MSDATTSRNAGPPAASRSIMQRLVSAAQAHSTRRLAVVFGLWAACAAVYWPTSRALNALWTSPAQEEAYTHGYLILLICLWLTARARKPLAAMPAPGMTPWALGLLLALSGLWLWAWRAAIQELHMMLLPLILLSAIAAALGWRAARVLVFPVGYLYFALPFWSGANSIVQTLSSKAIGALMWLAGISGYMQGNQIHLAGGTVEIARDCSGLHEFIVGLALAALYCKLVELPLGERMRAIGLMGILSLVVNWIRIFVVVLAAYTTDMHSSLVRNHYWLGWWLFAIVFAGYLWWMGRKPLPTPEDRPAPAAPAAAAPPRRRAPMGYRALTLTAGAVFLLVFWLWVRSSLANQHYWVGWSLSVIALSALLWWMWRHRVTARPAQPGQTGPRLEGASGPVSSLAPILVTFVATALLPVTAYAMDWSQSGAQPPLAIAWPAAPQGWEGPTHAYASEWKPHFVHASAEALRQYTSDSGESVQVFEVAYRRQTQRGKLLGYWNSLLGTAGDMRSLGQRIVHSPTGLWRETHVIDSAGLRSIIWSRYRIGRRVFVDPRLSQLWYGLVALIDPPLSSLTALRTDCEANCRAARARLAAASLRLQPTLR